MEFNFKGVLSIFGAIAYVLFGNDSQVINALTWYVYLMGIDVITGFIKANMQGNGSSRVFRQGLLKKIINLIFISFCYHVDVNMKLPFSLAILSIGAFSAGEGYSVIENFIVLGVPVPDKIKNLFEVSQGSEESGK